MPPTASAFLNVQSIEKSIEFYQGLGFKVAKEYRDEATGALRYADLALQGAELGLGAIAANDDPEYRAWVSTPLGAGVLLYFSVPNVDKVHDKAKAIGATIEMPLGDRSYGRGFNLNDPDGYVVSFITEKKRKPARKAGTRAKAAKAAKGKRGKASKRRSR